MRRIPLISTVLCACGKRSLPSTRQRVLRYFTTTALANYTASLLLHTTSRSLHPYPRIGNSRAGFSSDAREEEDIPDAVKEEVQAIQQTIQRISNKIGLSRIEKRLQELKVLLDDKELWSNPERAAEMNKEASQLSQQADVALSLASKAKEWVEIYKLASSEGESSLVEESVQNIRNLVDEAKDAHFDLLFASKADQGGCYLEVQAGAGGTESCDWADMLVRMYERWATDQGYQVRLIQEVPSEPAGIRHATLRIDGNRAYGWCKAEAGVHRLVRISPFDSSSKRHTSFAQVRTFPVEVGGDEVIKILPSDVRVDTFRAQGAGGQHVNTTESAVRLTHLATGITAVCQNNRSQHQNKAEAMKILTSKLYRVRQEQVAKEKAQYFSGLGDNSWGNQIRSYVMHPYQMVKDHRTGEETGNVTEVMAGGPALARLMESTLSLVQEDKTIIK